MVLQVPEQKPTPTVAPVMHCVVEIGSSVCPGVREKQQKEGVISQKGGMHLLLSLVAMMMVMVLPSSMEKPRDGECKVILLPKFLMML